MQIYHFANANHHMVIQPLYMEYVTLVPLLGLMVFFFQIKSLKLV